jgi:hypothetical protein
MGDADQLAVGVLRVVDSTGDGLRARLAADRLLTAARPAARGLRPHEILVVRTLRDPLPGACANAPSIAAVVRWRDAVESRLEEARCRAARPAAGPVPTGAPAVLFGDLAELLACLTIDGAAGVAAERWWWRSWLQTHPARESVERAWIEHAEQAPGTLELLSARRALATLPRALSPQAAVAITAAIVRGYALASLASAARVQPGSAPAAAAGRAAQTESDPVKADAPRPPASAAALALLAIVPELAGAGLPAEHRRLVALGLTVRRQRQATRRDDFRQAVDELAAAAAPPGPATPATKAPRSARAPERRAAGHEAAIETPPIDASRPTPKAAAAPAARPETGDSAEPAAASARGLAPAATSATSPAPRRAGSPAPSAADAAAIQTRTAVTQLGGLFLLPGVALHLGLYGDFSRPLDRAVDLDPWDLVALLGRALLPRAPYRDPAWEMLGELAGRAAGEPPGSGFRPSRSWRLPQAWLKPFGHGRGPWRWHAADGRLRTRHPAGFLALDVPLRGACATAQLERELRRWQGPPARFDPGLAIESRRAPVARWTQTWLAPYVGARLRLALGSRRPSHAVALTLRQRARVTLSPGRIDVTYALDDLPVAVRLAGLDRTPGWIPAAGRHLELHFA